MSEYRRYYIKGNLVFTVNLQNRQKPTFDHPVSDAP